MQLQHRIRHCADDFSGGELDLGHSHRRNPQLVIYGQLTPEITVFILSDTLQRAHQVQREDRVVRMQIRLFERASCHSLVFGEPGYHSQIIGTYGIDPYSVHGRAVRSSNHPVHRHEHVREYPPELQGSRCVQPRTDFPVISR